MRKWTVLTISAMVLSSLALAQPGQGPGQGPGNFSPELRKKLEAYRPVLELSTLVRMLADVDKEKKLAFSKAQAGKLLPILKDLKTRADIKPADAEKILANIEDKILTDAQLDWIDKTRLERQEEARRRQEQNGQGQQGQGVRVPGLPPVGGGNQQGGQRQGGPGGGGFFRAIMEGKPVNPFADGRGKENIEEIIAVLSKR